MRIEVEIKQKPRKNDIAIFTGEKWEVVSINKFLNEINNRIDKVEQKVSDVKDELKSTDEKINELSNEIKYLKGE